MRSGTLGQAGIVGILLAIAVLIGCSDARPTPPVATTAWLAPGFDDLPLPDLVGYQPEPGMVPLAARYAGGHLRRFDVRFQPRDGSAEETPQEALDRLASAMAGLGWTRLPVEPATDQRDHRQVRATARVGRFAKDDELAVITCVPDSGGSRIHLLVKPRTRG